MNNKELQIIYSMIDSLTDEEKKKVLAHLGASSQEAGFREIVTQDELDFLYSTLTQNSVENNDR
ncbi:hypothetical protein [Vibrio fluminensis]|uniref:hypothetical protein n=1 Tax=Vibrio fluminensis TaxID=2783614 RepID=UPI001887233F|nr:hypothetical protein [Vibrio fluminensis]